MTEAPGLKQFREAGCLSYLIWDLASRKAALIDPITELMDDYRAYVADHRLELGYAIDTHTHADHFSSSHFVRQQFGARIVMSYQTQSLRVDQRVRGGDRIHLGGFELEILETPGHTQDSLCVRAGGLLFAGDTLLVGTTGRLGYPGSDARQLYRTLHETLAPLPADLAVLPGHDYNQMVCTTLGKEFRRNPQLALPEEDFTALKQQEVFLAGAGDTRTQLAYNLEAAPGEMPHRDPGGPGTACGAGALDDDRFAAINVSKFWQKVRSPSPDSRFIDVREREEFEAGHVPGTRNIPLSEIPLHLEDLCAPERRIFLFCLSGRRSSYVARTLAYLGAANAANVTGGMRAWLQAGLPVEK